MAEDSAEVYRPVDRDGNLYPVRSGEDLSHGGMVIAIAVVVGVLVVIAVFAAILWPSGSHSIPRSPATVEQTTVR